MKISIITPTYNRHDCIHIAINSILDQTHKNWEMFIIDDCSDEPYDKYIEMLLLEYSRQVILPGKLSSNKNGFREYIIDEDRRIYLKRLPVRSCKPGDPGHPSPVRNSVINDITGELVCFRDDDGFWDQHYLELMSKAFHYEQTIMAYCLRKICRIENLIYFTQEFADSVGQDWNPTHEGKGSFKNGADTGDVMLRADIFKGVGGFGSPEETQGTEDMYLWKKIGEKYPDRKVAEVPYVLNYYIWHNSHIPTALRRKNDLSHGKLKGAKHGLAGSDP